MEEFLMKLYERDYLRVPMESEIKEYELILEEEKNQNEKYDRIFLQNFPVKKEDLPGLKYRGLKEWDSVGHMDLVGLIEETFGINLSTLDVLEFSTYEKGKTILAKYGVEI